MHVLIVKQVGNSHFYQKIANQTVESDEQHELRIKTRHQTSNEEGSRIAILKQRPGFGTPKQR